MTGSKIHAREDQQLVVEALAKYSKTVIKHWLEPKSFVPLERPDGHARITGPCGDTMEIFIRVSKGEISEASFLTHGCVTSIASASMAVELATGRSIAGAWSISQEDILDALNGLPEEEEHCALLATNTLRAAVDDYVKKRR